MLRTVRKEKAKQKGDEKKEKINLRKSEKVRRENSGSTFTSLSNKAACLYITATVLPLVKILEAHTLKSIQPPLISFYYVIYFHIFTWNNLLSPASLFFT